MSCLMHSNLSVMVVIALAARNLQNENNNKILLWCACSEGLWGYQALWNAWFAHSGTVLLPHPVFFEMFQWCDPFPPPVQAVSIVTSETYKYTTQNSSLQKITTMKACEKERKKMVHLMHMFCRQPHNVIAELFNFSYAHYLAPSLMDLQHACLAPPCFINLNIHIHMIWQGVI